MGLIGGNGPALLAICWSEALLATVMCGLRAYAASRTPAGNWRWDFVYTAIGTAVGIAAIALLTVAVRHGLGEHVEDLDLAELLNALHYMWTCIFLGIVCLMFAKIGVIALLLQIEDQAASRIRYWSLWFIGFILTSTIIVQVFVSLFQCDPYTKLWDVYEAGLCPRTDFAVSWSKMQGYLSVVIDVALGLWPILIVKKLNMKKNVKIGFCCLMAVAMLPAIAAVNRVIQLPLLLNSSDPTYDFFLFMVWAVTEAWTVVILGSIPPLRPLFMKIFFGIKIGGDTHHSSHGRTGAMTPNLSSKRTLGRGFAVTTEKDGTSRGTRVDDLDLDDEEELRLVPRPPTKSAIGSSVSVTTGGKNNFEKPLPAITPASKHQRLDSDEELGLGLGMGREITVDKEITVDEEMSIAEGSRWRP